MASTFTVSRSHLIYGLCLPLAVILGFVLAEPMDSSSLAVVVMVFSVLATPLLIKWYHPVLVFSWNAAFYMGFLPGALPLWFVVAGLGFVFVVLNRCLGTSSRLMVGGHVAWSLLAIGLVVAGTAMFSGGIALWSLGGGSLAGGKKYFFIWAAIAGYFVLASRRIPRERAMWYTGLFVLPGVTALLGNLVYMMGKGFSGLYWVIPAGGAVYQAAAEGEMPGADSARIGGWLATAQAVCVFLLARYGIRGILDITKPWRFALLAGFLAAGMFGGFRSFLVIMGLVFVVAFFLEGLHRTRYMAVMLILGTVCGLGLFAFANKLPFSMQRSLSFLPLDISPAARQSADGSLEWRLEMWRAVLPEVPRYLLKGKGYSMNLNEFDMAFENSARGGFQAEAAALAGDYHSGPLSVMIPFGLWGALAFGWFLISATRMLYRNYKHGDPGLTTINRALLACFIAKIVFFLFAFGSFSSDMAYFAGLAGFGLCLNGDLREWSSQREWIAAPIAANT